MKIYFVHDYQEVEDNRFNWLETAGYEVQMFKGSIELGIALRDEEPDLLLLDVLLEGKNGFETAREVSLKHPEREFPIVLCSRIYRGRQFSTEAQRSGVQAFILLPKPETEFVRRIKQAIAHFVPTRDLDEAA